MDMNEQAESFTELSENLVAIKGTAHAQAVAAIFSLENLLLMTLSSTGEKQEQVQKLADVGHKLFEQLLESLADTNIRLIRATQQLPALDRDALEYQKMRKEYLKSFISDLEMYYKRQASV